MTRRRASLLALLGGAVALVAFWVSQISGAPIDNDAGQTLRMALNLERHGVISRDIVPPFEPTMYREPLPVWTTALSVKLTDALFGQEEPEAYFEGDRARYLKYLNLVWFAALTVSAFWACYLFTSSVPVSAAAALLVNIDLPMTAAGVSALGINSLYSEQAAAALLIAGSAFVALAVARGSSRFAAAAGVSFGLLALTKAVTLYVCVGLLLVLLCLLPSIARRFLPNRMTWRTIAISVLAFAVTVAPWLYRNYVHFGSWQITERGGAVLYMRSVKNQMTAEEFRGAFYVWAPGLRDFWGSILGYSEADLQEGGRLQRLNRTMEADFFVRDYAAEQAGNPAGAISYYRKARAERTRLTRLYEARGVPNAEFEADRVLQEQALSEIRNNLGRHLVMTLPFIWRGALTTTLALILCLGYALYRRRTDFALFVVPGFGSVAFYALFSHFISRYAVPVVPIAVISGLVLLSAVWTYMTMARTRRLSAGH